MGPPISTWIVLTERPDPNNLRLLVLDAVVNKVPDPDAWEMQLSRRASTQYLQEKRPHDGKAKSLWFLP